MTIDVEESGCGIDAEPLCDGFELFRCPLLRTQM
jgi:hypothetical protein